MSLNTFITAAYCDHLTHVFQSLCARLCSLGLAVMPYLMVLFSLTLCEYATSLFFLLLFWVGFRLRSCFSCIHDEVEDLVEKVPLIHSLRMLMVRTIMRSTSGMNDGGISHREIIHLWHANSRHVRENVNNRSRKRFVAVFGKVNLRSVLELGDGLGIVRFCISYGVSRSLSGMAIV